MSKRRTTRKPEKKKPASRANGSQARSRVIKPNGGLTESVPVSAEPVPERIPIGEAMRQAVEQLGARTIPADARVLQNQMNELADIFEDVTRREAAYTAKADEAKTAKKSLESAVDLLKEKVRMFTHATPLPLFDHQQREDDHQAMLDGDTL